MLSAVSAPLSPSKTHRDENFPVASLLLSAKVRGHILDFYRFARTADDIADTPDLAVDEKLRRLDGMNDDLRRNAPLWMPYAMTLLQAFRQDVCMHRYQSWDDLVAYCRCSAVPVGRLLLDLHDESSASYAAADSLCIALQILNHLQDCGNDYSHLGRIYLPQDDMKQYGVTEAVLAEPHTTPNLRRLLDHLLEQTAPLLAEAQGLLRTLRSRRLRLEAAVTLTMAEKLAQTLRRHDPLAESVRLSTPQIVVTVITGLKRGWL